jgi:uracil phosphoribosyltransferase
MVATGGSLSDAIDVIKTKEPKEIFSLNIIGCPEGISVIEKKHPDIKLYIAQIDERLDSNMFILPGLGDAGDRAYNTPE